MAIKMKHKKINIGLVFFVVALFVVSTGMSAIGNVVKKDTENDVNDKIMILVEQISTNDKDSKGEIGELDPDYIPFLFLNGEVRLKINNGSVKTNPGLRLPFKYLSYKIQVFGNWSLNITTPLRSFVFNSVDNNDILILRIFIYNEPDICGWPVDHEYNECWLYGGFFICRGLIIDV